MQTSERLERLLPLALFVACFALYTIGSLYLADTGMHKRDNVFFRSDTGRVFRNFTNSRKANHDRNVTHPAFVLLHNPLGRGLTFALEAAGLEPRVARQRASSALTATAGAGAAALGFLLLRAVGVSLGTAGFFAAALGGSAAHVAFASIPETWIFSALALTLLAWTAVRAERPAWHFLLAAVYAISVLTTNLVPVAILGTLRAALRGGARPGAVLASAAGTAASALALVVLLSLAQRALYPITTLFFEPSLIAEETKWIKWSHWFEEPATTVKILVRTLVIDDVVAPAPLRTEHDGLAMASIEHAGRPQYRSRLPALAAWGLVLAIAGVGALRGALRRPPVLAALAVLAYSFAFHSVFGNDRFLYACSWTVFAVLTVAVCFDTALPRAGRARAAGLALLAAFLALEVASNLGFLVELRAAVKSDAGG